jgi:hypothetical protein
MTAVGAVAVAGEPAVIVVDVVLTALGERSEGGYAGKI